MRMMRTGKNAKYECRPKKPKFMTLFKTFGIASLPTFSEKQY